jgi:hypothetical protein
MWAWNKGYPRKTLGVPIKPAYGMGSTEENNYEVATPINPKGSPIWSETWQQRGAGALKQRHPFAMNGCGCGSTNGETEQTSRHWLGLGLLMAFGVALFYLKKD